LICPVVVTFLLRDNKHSPRYLVRCTISSSSSYHIGCLSRVRLFVVHGRLCVEGNGVVVLVVYEYLICGCIPELNCNGPWNQSYESVIYMRMVLSFLSL
jgi:hypothetical protein